MNSLNIIWGISKYCYYFWKINEWEELEEFVFKVKVLMYYKINISDVMKYESLELKKIDSCMKLALNGNTKYVII